MAIKNPSHVAGDNFLSNVQLSLRVDGLSFGFGHLLLYDARQNFFALVGNIFNARAVVGVVGVILRLQEFVRAFDFVIKSRKQMIVRQRGFAARTRRHASTYNDISDNAPANFEILRQTLKVDVIGKRNFQTDF